MKIFNYGFGFLKSLLNGRVSKLAIIDKYSTIHKTSRICRFVKLVKSDVCKYTYLAPRTELVHVSIGNFCSVGPECKIGLAHHSIKHISTSPIFTSKKNALMYKWVSSNSFTEYKQVKIHNDVWIGARTMIMGGVTIGNGVVIGAGSIVTKDVPDYAVIAGTPAKIIKYRFNDLTIQQLLELRWWNLPDSAIKANIKEFSINAEDINILNSFKINK